VLQSTKAAKRGGKCVVSIVEVIISLGQGPKPAVLAGRKRMFHCFVVGSINCHSESEKFLKFFAHSCKLLEDVSWRF
jgi:hypothetical protein